MKRKKNLSKLLVVTTIVLFCVFSLCCKIEPKELNESSIEHWSYKLSEGYITGSINLDSYRWKFLTESEWTYIKTYTVTGSSYIYSWDRMTTQLRSWNFTNSLIEELRAEILSKRKATYFYLNTNNNYHWFRVEIDSYY